MKLELQCCIVVQHSNKKKKLAETFVHEVAREAERTERILKWTSERFRRIRQKNEVQESTLASTVTNIHLPKDAKMNDENKMNESEVEDALPMLTKAQKFTFSSLESIPVEMHVNA
uniref:Protein FAR1-RELATED SEQUENCE n=1 Tax=Angiostrongylus cantonensis TaxID=6313 RepID=A0A0K0DE14_ANGCA